MTLSCFSSSISKLGAWFIQPSVNNKNGKVIRVAAPHSVRHEVPEMSQDTIVLDVHSIIEISDGNYDNTNYRENSKMHPILGKHTRDGISTNLDADANTFISVSSHDSGDSSPLQSTQKGNAPVPPPPYTFQDSACKNENYNYAEAERRTITHQKHQQLRQQEQQSQPAVKNPKSIFKPDTDIFKFPQHSHSHKIENFSQFVRHLLHRADVSRSVYIVALIYYRRVLSKTGPNNDHQRCTKCLMLCCIVLASKYVEDLTYLNKAWAYWGDVSIPHLNTVEHWILQTFDFNVSVTTSEFETRAAHYKSNLSSAAFSSPKHVCSTASLPGCSMGPPLPYSKSRGGDIDHNRDPKMCLTAQSYTDKFNSVDRSVRNSDDSDPLCDLSRKNSVPASIETVVSSQPDLPTSFVARSTSMPYTTLQSCAESAQQFLLRQPKNTRATVT